MGKVSLSVFLGIRLKDLPFRVKTAFLISPNAMSSLYDLPENKPLRGLVEHVRGKDVDDNVRNQLLL